MNQQTALTELRNKGWKFLTRTRKLKGMKIIDYVARKDDIEIVRVSTYSMLLAALSAETNNPIKLKHNP